MKEIDITKELHEKLQVSNVIVVEYEPYTKVSKNGTVHTNYKKVSKEIKPIPLA